MSLERMTSPFDSPIRSHVIGSPAASDRSDEGQAGQSPRLEAPLAQVALTNGNLKRIACSREETVETLSAKVLPCSPPRTRSQRLPFTPPGTSINLTPSLGVAPQHMDSSYHQAWHREGCVLVLGHSQGQPRAALPSLLSRLPWILLAGGQAGGAAEPAHAERACGCQRHAQGSSATVVAGPRAQLPQPGQVWPQAQRL